MYDQLTNNQLMEQLHMFNSLQSLWYQKHRPLTLDKYVFQNPHHKKSFHDMVITKTVPHLLLTGGPGTGKSAISNIIINACMEEEDQSIDLLKLNASDENSVEVVRSKIYSHITSMGVGPFKIVWLEEADYLSPSAQGVLRDYMEKYETTCRFIITCNNIHKISPAIRSRAHQYNFAACDKDDVLQMAAELLVAEDIKLSLDCLEKHVDLHYPDMRSIINSLEQHSKTGSLTDPSADTPMQSVKLDIVEYVAKDAWSELRTKLCSTISDDEWEEVYEYLYTNLDKSPKFGKMDKWEQGIVLIAEHLNNHMQCAKPSINAASLLIQLGGL